MKIKSIKRALSLILLFAMLLQLCSCGGIIYKVSEETKENADEGESSVVEETETEASKEKKLNILCVGDNMNHSSIFNEAQALAAGKTDVGYYYDGMYENVADEIKSADIAFVNQEAPICADGAEAQGYPYFNAPEDAGTALVNLGFDVVNIANNHMLDMNRAGHNGYGDSIAFWKNQDVLLIGGYEDEDDYYTLHITEKNGIKIAWLSFTYGTNGISLESSSNEAVIRKENGESTYISCDDVSKLVVPYIDKEVIKKQIEAAKASSDFVFVSVHWGEEGSFTPSAYQTDLAQYITDCGADVIIGHHSHTIQPIKWLSGADGNKTLCIYSLGNFLCTMLYPYYILGGMFNFSVSIDENGNKLIDNVYLEPIVIHYNADASKLDADDLPTRDGIKIYYLKDYTDTLCSEHGSQLYQSFSLDTLYGYVKNTIDSEFLPEWLK